MLIQLIGFLAMLLTLTIYVVVAQAILSWLIAFNVINTYNEIVRTIWISLDRLIAPLLKPIRRVTPDFGGIDFSPMVLILILIFLRDVVLGGLARNLTGG